jgi:LmbE family N-acetylglucosaminyl deacetylase
MYEAHRGVTSEASRRRWFPAVSRGALILFVALAGFPSVAAARTILVFAPHPDDEALIAAGRIRANLAPGNTVKVVVVTNGDVGGVPSGLAREGESVAGAQALGLTEQDVIFLGYPDGSMLNIYNAASPTQVFTSAAGRTSTYGNRGMGGMDYHTFTTGAAGPYNHVTVAGDIQSLLTTYVPDEIYTLSNFDAHPDHQATALFITEALVSLKRSGSTLASKLYQSLVWAPAQGQWPDPTGAGGCAPSVPFAQPQMGIQLEWNRLWRWVVPTEMQSPDPSVNLKCQMISQYRSQLTPWLLSWSRKDEFFWMSDFGANLAIAAQVTVSSENTANNQGGLKAIDGVIDGSPHDPAREWVTSNQLSGAWIQLNWPSPVSVSQVNLYDRPDSNENVLAGTLSFSDGSTVSVGALEPHGLVMPVTFPPKTVTSVRFTIDQAQGTATGLSEIQVLGLPGTATGNVAPYFIQGPVANTSMIGASQTANFSVVANDLNGDAVQYQWSVDGGSIQGSGPTALFTPPAVAANTVFTITSQILDGRGGSASNVGFVTVIPAVDRLSVNPAALVGGNSAQGTITLANAAPAGGLSVPLSSSNPAAAAVPASVTVPGGNVTANFTVTTGTVSAATTVTLSANINGTPRPAMLTVNAPDPNLLISSDSIGDANWGNWGTMTSTLNFATAPDGTQHATRAVVTQPGGHALVQQVSVVPNTNYVFSFYARNNGGTAASYSVYDVTHNVDIVPSTPYILSINSSTWTQVSVRFTTPAGCNSIYVYTLRDSGFPVDILLWRATLTPAQAAASLAATMSAAPNPVSQGSPLSVTLSVTNTGQAAATAVAPSGFTVGGAGASCPASSTPASANIAGGATQVFSWACTASSTTGTATFSAGATGTDANSGATVSAAPASASTTIQQGLPTISSFTPASGLVGTPVTISGANFSGATAVTFNSLSASYTVSSSSTIVATVPLAATSGPVSVTTPAGTATSTSNFTVRVTLGASTAGNGAGTVTSVSSPNSATQINCGAACSAVYDLGSVVTLTATPAIGSNYTSWSGCDSVSGNACTVNMNAARSVTAIFTLQTFPLTVNKTHLLTGNGTVTSTSSPASPSQINCGGTCSVSYNYGTVVTLTATPELLSLFNGWSGCDSTSGTTCTVTIGSARSVTASFLP